MYICRYSLWINDLLFLLVPNIHTFIHTCRDWKKNTDKNAHTTALKYKILEGKRKDNSDSLPKVTQQSRARARGVGQISPLPALVPAAAPSSPGPGKPAPAADRLSSSGPSPPAKGYEHSQD